MPVLPDSSQLSFQHSVSLFLVLSVVVSRYCHPSISSRLVSSLSQFPVYISSSCESSRYECGAYWRIVSCLLLSLGVAGGTSLFGIQVTWVQVMGIFFRSVAQESKRHSRSVGTTPCRGGDRLSCHGKVYEDECRVASCKYHLAKRKGMAHRWVTGWMLMQTILPLSSQDWIFFLSFSWFCLLCFLF